MVRYHRAYLRLHKQYEEYAYPIIKRALAIQLQPVIKWLDTNDPDSLELYLPFLLQGDPIREALAEIYPKIGANAARFEYDYINQQAKKAERKDSIFSFFNAEWIKQMVDFFLLNAGNKIQGITDTTVKQVRRVIAESQELNLSTRDQAKYIQETLSMPEFDRARALVIARTESTTAANYGINVGAESSDYIVNKIWISTLDKRTRRSHILARDLPPVPMTGFFMVGGVKMKFPGDPSAPADEVVNCRCVMGTEIILDEFGLPVLKPQATFGDRIANAR